jgi:hypothetical protein
MHAIVDKIRECAEPDRLRGSSWSSYLLRKIAEGSWLRRKTGWNTIAKLLSCTNEGDEDM